MKKMYKLQDLDCANCAAKMEDCCQENSPVCGTPRSAL